MIRAAKLRGMCVMRRIGVTPRHRSFPGYGDSALFVLHSQRCIADGINGLDPLAASKGRRPGSNPRVQPLIGGIFPLLSLC